MRTVYALSDDLILRVINLLDDGPGLGIGLRKTAIDSFTCAPCPTIAGTPITLSWQTTGATSAFINQGVGSVAVDGSTTVYIYQGGSRTYTLTATNSAGSITRSVTVRIYQNQNELPPDDEDDGDDENPPPL